MLGRRSLADWFFTRLPAAQRRGAGASSKSPRTRKSVGRDFERFEDRNGPSDALTGLGAQAIAGVAINPALTGAAGFASLFQFVGAWSHAPEAAPATPVSATAAPADRYSFAFLGSRGLVDGAEAPATTAPPIGNAGVAPPPPDPVVPAFAAPNSQSTQMPDLAAQTNDPAPTPPGTIQSGQGSGGGGGGGSGGAAPIGYGHSADQPASGGMPNTIDSTQPIAPTTSSPSPPASGGRGPG